MKRIFLIVNLLLACAGMTFAQTKPKADTTKAKAKTTATATTAKPAAGPLKKDGTADMRYKANKDAAKAKPAGPLKKDGTPDMRYKANKIDTTKKKKS
jgi:hypothetical protein